MIPDVICELDKAIYFQPLPDIYGRIGISIVEVNSKLSLNLEKILPNLIYLINNKNQMIQRDSINVLSSILENTKNLKIGRILNELARFCRHYFEPETCFFYLWLPQKTLR